MIFIRRRRPLARAAVVGGLAYGAGRHAANSANRENEQEARINELEAQAAEGTKGGTTTPAATPQVDITSKLQELASMKSQGLLTQEEYDAAKQKLLNT
jgi:hypothetical protein